MKKIALFLMLIVLSGCSATAPDISDGQTQNPDPIVKPIVASFGNGESKGYVVGGMVNGELVSYQVDDNYKLFDLTGEESYILFSDDGETATAETADVETTFVSSVGMYETIVTFDDAIDYGSKFIGIGNADITATEKSVGNNSSFELDFDKDGKTETIIVEESEENIVVNLENQQGKTNIAEIVVDDVYTSDYALFTVDVNGDGNVELVLCKYGHDYSTEVYGITSDSLETLIEYYMGN